jgi:ribosome maturation factor RimP
MIDNIERIVKDSLPDEGYFVVELEQDQNAIIRLTVDHENGIGIDDIAKISRAINRGIHDQKGEEADFQLEVSSPGADTPLRHLAQFKRHLGRTLEIKPEEGKPFHAELIGFEDDHLIVKEKILPTKQQPKVKYGEEKVLMLSDDQEIRIVIEFK